MRSMMIFFIIYLFVYPSAADGITTWYLQRDNLSEYQVLSSSPGVLSISHCLIQADSFDGVHGAMLVPSAVGSYDCIFLRCLLGTGGCRKCRNAKNSSMPNIWVRAPSTVSCWTTFQHRVDASVSFNRNWTDYAAGFGQGVDGNYWMGLDRLYSLVSAQNCAITGACRIRWEFSDWNGVWYWAENPEFSIASSLDKYRLSFATVDSVRSNVGQIATNHHWSPNSVQFSTPDSDNDNQPVGTCAVRYGWWFNWCGAINPNGNYYFPPVATNGTAGGMIFYFYPGSAYPLAMSYSMRSFEILFG